jgi:hypothetical protein
VIHRKGHEGLCNRPENMSDGDWSVQSGRTSFSLNFKNRFGTVKLRFSKLRWLPNAAGQLDLPRGN